jgi:hypothetical protein
MHQFSGCNGASLSCGTSTCVNLRAGYALAVPARDFGFDLESGRRSFDQPTVPGTTMKKLLAALIVGAFAFTGVAIAQEKKAEAKKEEKKAEAKKDEKKDDKAKK